MEKLPHAHRRTFGVCALESIITRKQESRSIQGDAFFANHSRFRRTGCLCILSALSIARCGMEHLWEEIRRRNVRRVAEPSWHSGDGQFRKKHKSVPVLHHNGTAEEECSHRRMWPIWTASWLHSERYWREWMLYI